MLLSEDGANTFDELNTKWQFDGVATFFSCKEICACSHGSYNRSSKECVVNTGSPGPLPFFDGDLSDGFYVLGGIVYQEVGDGRCPIRAV